MKKIIVALILWLSIFALSINAYPYISPAADASEQVARADTLCELGLFKGTESGYELDRTANRAEAVVMLVRLLGKESDALNGDYTHPFTDVPDWASPYIAYAYTEGITKGTSDTTFEPYETVSEKMYLTFLLRVLGVENAWDDTEKLAWTNRLSFEETTAQEFLRSRMVDLSLNFLYAREKPYIADYIKREFMLTRLYDYIALSPMEVVALLREHSDSAEYIPYPIVDEFGNTVEAFIVENQNFDNYSVDMRFTFENTEPTLDGKYLDIEPEKDIRITLANSRTSARSSTMTYIDTFVPLTATLGALGYECEYTDGVINAVKTGEPKFKDASESIEIETPSHISARYLLGDTGYYKAPETIIIDGVTMEVYGRLVYRMPAMSSYAEVKAMNILLVHDGQYYVSLDILSEALGLECDYVSCLYTPSDDNAE